MRKNCFPSEINNLESGHCSDREPRGASAEDRNSIPAGHAAGTRCLREPTGLTDNEPQGELRLAYSELSESGNPGNR